MNTVKGICQTDINTRQKKKKKKNQQHLDIFTKPPVGIEPKISPSWCNKAPCSILFFMSYTWMVSSLLPVTTNFSLAATADIEAIWAWCVKFALAVHSCVTNTQLWSDWHLNEMLWKIINWIKKLRLHCASSHWKPPTLAHSMAHRLLLLLPPSTPGTAQFMLLSAREQKVRHRLLLDIKDHTQLQNKTLLLTFSSVFTRYPMVTCS